MITVMLMTCQTNRVLLSILVAYKPSNNKNTLYWKLLHILPNRSAEWLQIKA